VTRGVTRLLYQSYRMVLKLVLSIDRIIIHSISSWIDFLRNSLATDWDIIATCRFYFNIQLPISAQIKSRTVKFVARYRLAKITFCRIFSWLCVDMFWIVWFAVVFVCLFEYWLFRPRSYSQWACLPAAGCLCYYNYDWFFFTVVMLTVHCLLLLLYLPY
jgi:hypothetical protein